MSLSAMLVVIIAQIAQPGASGNIVATIGPVEVQRSGGRIEAAANAPVQSGDRIVTGPQSSAGLYLDRGLLIYLGRATNIDLPTVQNEPVFQLSTGEARFTSGGPAVITVNTPTAKAELGRGILRVAVGQNETRAWCESGKALITRTQPPQARRSTTTVAFADPPQVVSWQLNAGEVITIPLQGDVVGPAPVADVRSSIDVAALQNAAALAASNAQKENLTANLREDDQRRRGETQAEQGQPSTGRRGYNEIVSTAAGAANSSFGFAGASGLSNSGGSYGDNGGRPDSGIVDQDGDPFPGNAFTVTAETAYTLSSVQLQPSDNFPTAAAPQYWSIRSGAAGPNDLQIPGFDYNLVLLNNNAEFGSVTTGELVVTDSTRAPGYVTPNSAPLRILGMPGDGFYGNPPAGPNASIDVGGKIALRDERAEINDRLTFSLGELRADSNGTDNPRFALRRSDQDRQIDAQDSTTLHRNTQVTGFTDQTMDDGSILMGDKIPNGLSNPPTLRNVDTLRRAAFTTLMADQLSGFAQRTGQTRFIVDGKLIDIRGYKK